MAIFYIAAIFFVALDRLLKLLAVRYYSLYTVSIYKDLFKFKFTSNPNIAFSIPLSGYCLDFLIVMMVLGMVYFLLDLIRKDEVKTAWYLFLVILGALSNLLDRLKFGYVIDYFDLRYFTVFNLADCMIVGGGIFLLWRVIKKEPT